jgi:hypothetical protein
MSDEKHEGSPTHGQEVSALARDLYLDFLSSEVAGEVPDFEAFCRAHHELDGELRHLRRGDLFVGRDAAEGEAFDEVGEPSAADGETNAPGLVSSAATGRPTCRQTLSARGRAPDAARGVRVQRVGRSSRGAALKVLRIGRAARTRRRTTCCVSSGRGSPPSSTIQDRRAQLGIDRTAAASSP